MRTYLNTQQDQSSYSLYHIEKLSDSTKNVQITGFYSSPQGAGWELILYSPLFKKEPNNIKVNDNKLVITIEESVKTLTQDRFPEYAWGNYFYHSYVRFHQVIFLLPGDNFFMVKSVLIPDELMLKVILAPIGLYS